MRRTALGIALAFLSTELACAEEDGFVWGSTVWRPTASVGAAYDNRVAQDPAGGYDADAYATWEAGVSMHNLPALINYSASGRYGQRYYRQLNADNSYYYHLRGAVASGDSPFIWALSTDLDRTLDYNTTYDPETGQEPDSILTSEPSTRSVTQGSIGYDIKASELTSIRPFYSMQHYYQTFSGSDPAEWQIHSADVQLRRKHSEKTAFTLTGAYSLQVNDEEEGYIGTLLLGVESQSSDKTSWQASIGYSLADYDLSGTDQGGVVNLRGNWNTTEKITLYVFGGNDFQPGYDGGAARLVYRLGYGLGWSPIDKITFGASVLHDYQDEIGSNTSTDPALGTLRHFFNASLGYQLLEGLDASLGYRFVDDEESQNQQVISINLGYTY